MAAKNKFLNAMKMPSIDDMFSSEADRQRESGDLVTEVPLSELHPFVGHPFEVRDDEDMQKLVDSIRENGVLTNLTVRRRAEGGYEIISGHRRFHAAQRAGLTAVKVQVRDIDDDQAIISMVDSNIQREHISQTVTLPEGTYYCNAAIQYDALNDWPLREVDGTTFLQVEAGGQYELQYEFAGESWFMDVTGQTRYYTQLPLRQPPADYQPTTAQVSAYLTAPVGFSQHCIVYLQNLYSGTVYALDVYESNQLAAVCTEADSGLYALLSARVVGDATERYQFECEQKELNTDDGASFHLTVTDTKNPDADLSTPSHDENTTVQRAASYNAPTAAAPSATPTPEPTSSQLVQRSKKSVNPFWNVLDFLPIVFIGAGLFWFRRKNRRGGPKG